MLKKNNLFMLAYILFLTICICVRIFGEFPMWSTIVSAITISSWFFAIADSNSSDATELRQINSIWLQYTDKEKTKANKILEHILAKKENFIKNDDEKNKQMTQEITSLFDDVIRNMNKIKEYDEDVQKELESNEKKANRYGKTATVYTILGFLTFFCIMSFKTISDIATGMQDTATVSAFGIILCTQYRSELRREKNKIDEQKIMNLAKLWNDFCEYVEEKKIDAD